MASPAAAALRSSRATRMSTTMAQMTMASSPPMRGNCAEKKDHDLGDGEVEEVDGDEDEAEDGHEPCEVEALCCEAVTGDAGGKFLEIEADEHGLAPIGEEEDDGEPFEGAGFCAGGEDEENDPEEEDDKSGTASGRGGGEYGGTDAFFGCGGPPDAEGGDGGGDEMGEVADGGLTAPADDDGSHLQDDGQGEEEEAVGEGGDPVIVGELEEVGGGEVERGGAVGAASAAGFAEDFKAAVGADAFGLDACGACGGGGFRSGGKVGGGRVGGFGLFAREEIVFGT